MVGEPVRGVSFCADREEGIECFDIFAPPPVAEHPIVTPKIFLIDDDEAVCESIERFLTRCGLEFQSYRSASSFLENWDEIRTQTGCLLIDLHLADENGFALLDELGARDFEMPFVMISGRGLIPDATTAMRRGAIDFLEKPFDPKLLLQRLREGIERDRSRWEKRSKQRLFAMRYKSLTDREREVLALVVEGMQTKAIATELGISAKTVEVHRGNLNRKMGVGNSVELVRMVARYKSLNSGS